MVFVPLKKNPDYPEKEKAKGILVTSAWLAQMVERQGAGRLRAGARDQH